MKSGYKFTKQILVGSIIILFPLMLLLIGLNNFQVNVDWYSSLNMPSIIPPRWIFTPMWIVLYLMIATSVVIILETKVKKTNKKDKIIAISLFIINGILNAIYSILFFGMKSILLAFLEQPFLIVSILLLIWCVYRINKIATYLLIPYLLWVCFGTVLTGITLFMN